MELLFYLCSEHLKTLIMEHVNETRNGNYITRTYHDDSTESPRDWDNLGTMVCFHNRYDLGDKHNYNSNDYNGWDEMEKDIIKRENVGVILPLYLYDHSGITMNTTGFSCNWDSGRVGFIFISKQKMLQEYGGKIVTQKLKDRVEGYLKSEVETYDQFLTGDVYGYRVFKEENGVEEELDSCWGFYGEDTCMEEGVGIMEYYISQEVVTDEEYSDMLHSVDKN
jgi:hypothetical protein